MRPFAIPLPLCYTRTSSTGFVTRVHAERAGAGILTLVYALQRVLMRGRLWRVLAVLAVCLVLGGLAGALVALLTPIYAAALAVGAAGGLLMLRSHRFTLAVIVAVICLFPFGSVPLNVGFSPTFLNLALGLMLFVWALRIATGRQEPWASSPISPAVTIFLLLTFATFVAGLGHASLTTSSLRKFAEVPLGIALYFAVLNTVRTRKDVEQLTLWLVLGGTAAAAIGIFLYVIPRPLATSLLSALGRFRYPSGAGVLRYVEDNPNLALRAISTSVDPNVLGALLVLIMGLAAPHLLAPRPFLRRAWLILAMAVSGICLILTYSRGSFAGLVAGLSLLGLVGRYRRWLLIVLLVGLLVLCLPQTQTYVAHFLEGVQGLDRATQMRFGEYKDALILIQRYPWMGVGFVSSPDIDTYIGVSNLYLLIAEQMGLVGLSAFLLAVVTFFLTLFAAWRRQGPPGALSPWLLGPAVAIAGGLAGGLLDHTLFSFPHALTLFWLIVGLGAATARLAQQESHGAA